MVSSEWQFEEISLLGGRPKLPLRRAGLGGFEFCPPPVTGKPPPPLYGFGLLGGTGGEAPGGLGDEDRNSARASLVRCIGGVVCEGEVCDWRSSVMDDDVEDEGVETAGLGETGGGVPYEERGAVGV